MKRKARSTIKSIIVAVLFLAVAVMAVTSFAEEKATGGATVTNPPVETEKAEELPKGISFLKFKGGLLSLKAEGAELAEVLSAISKETGVGIDNPEEISGKVTLEVKGSWLQDGVRRVLESSGQNNFAINFNDSKENRLYKITILKAGKAGAEKGATIAQTLAKAPVTILGKKWKVEEANTYFKNKYGPSWRVEIGNPSYGYPFRVVSGEFPDLDKITNYQEALRFVESFIADNPEAFPLAGAELVPSPRNMEEEYWHISLDQFYKGISVEDGGVTFDFLGGKKIRFLNGIGMPMDFSVVPNITVEDAIEIARKDLKKLREKGVKHDPVYLPERLKKGSLAISNIMTRDSNLSLVWKIYEEDFQYWIDANTGKIGHSMSLHTYSTVDCAVRDSMYGNEEGDTYVGSEEHESTPLPNISPVGRIERRENPTIP